MLSQYESMIQANSHYDSSVFHKFNEKRSIFKNFSFFRRALAAIYAIHEFGANKYAYYSWQNTPEKSDSLLENSLDAIKRHLLLYRTGQLIDESGIHHIGHIVCRAGSMALTRFYRVMMKTENTQKVMTRKSTSDFLQIVKQNQEDESLPYRTDQISPETYLSILKFQDSFIPSSVDECIDLIEECLHRCMFHKSLEDFDPYNDICYLDMIFWCATFVLNTLPEIDFQCSNYLSSIETNQIQTPQSGLSGLPTSSLPG